MDFFTSSTDQGSGLAETSTATSKFIITFIYAASIMFGLAGNIIAIYFAFTKMADNRITNILILNMAVADLLVTISVMPISVLLCVGNRWMGGIFGEISCKIVHFLYQISIPASILVVMVVSIDCFFAIVYPMKLRVLPKTKMTTFVIWVSSASYAVPYMISYRIQERDDIYYCSRCFLPLSNTTSAQIYYLTTFFFLYCAPLLILMVLYTLMSRKLWKRKISGIVTEERLRSSEQEKRRVIIALISITVVFAVLWFPAHVSNGNRTEWSPIRSVIIRVITKSDDRAAGVQFVYHEYDYRPNWTTRSPITN